MDLHETLIAYIHEDAPGGDITSERVIPDDSTCRAEIRVGQDGIIAGLDELSFLAGWAGLLATLHAADGRPVKKGTIVATCEGNTRKVLLIERTVLNIIGRMSGIATMTFALAAAAREKNPACRVSATRKTAPGCRFIDKKAVFLGGGDPHRAGLSDGILIKDNHLMITPLREAIGRAREVSRYSLIEVEVETMETAVVAAREGADIILLDNMQPEAIRSTIDALTQSGLRKHILLEASGRITPENLDEYASSGVDLVSLGCLTHSVVNLDVSMDFVDTG